MPKTLVRKSAGKRIVSQTTISPAFQTTLAAEAVRTLKLRPGMKLSQTVEGNRLILEPLEDVDHLAGSLGANKPPISISKMNKGTKAAIAAASRQGTRRRA